MDDPKVDPVTGDPLPDSGTTDPKGDPSQQPSIDWEKRYKDEQSHLTTIQQENAGLRESVAELKGRVDQFSTMNEPAQPQSDPYDYDEETLDGFRNDPATLVEVLKQERASTKAMIEENNRQVVDLLSARDAANAEQIGEVKTTLKQYDPEILPWKSAIEGLKAKEEFKALPDATLIAIAREKGMTPDYTDRGATPAHGQRPRETSGSKPPTAEARAETKRNYRLTLARGDEAKAEKLTKRHYKEEAA